MMDGNRRIGYSHDTTKCIICKTELSYNGCDIMSKPIYCEDCRITRKEKELKDKGYESVGGKL